MSIKVLVVDDHEAVRAGLRLAFHGTDLEVVDDVTTVEGAIRAILAVRLDVVLLDLKLPDGGGFEVLRWVRKEMPDLPVLMYSLLDDPFWVKRSRELGANGYVSKDASVTTLLQAIRQVSQGETCWPAGMTDTVTT